MASNDRHEISRQQLAVSLFVNPVAIGKIRLEDAGVPKERRINRVGRKWIVVDAQPVEKIFLVALLPALDDMGGVRLGVEAEGRELNIWVGVLRKGARLAHGGTAIEDHRADFFVGWRRE